MTSQMKLDVMDRVAPATPAPARALPPDPTLGRKEIPTPQEPTFAEQQGLAMSWVGIALGMFLLLGGLALWAAVAFSAGFGGWLLGTGLMGLIIVAVVVTVNYVLLRPRR
jgi:hypothetical protein